MKTWHFIIRKDRADGEILERGKITARSKSDVLDAILPLNIGNHVSVWR